MIQKILKMYFYRNISVIIPLICNWREREGRFFCFFWRGGGGNSGLHLVYTLKLIQCGNQVNQTLMLFFSLSLNVHIPVDCPKDDDVEGWVVSSESCSFQSIGAQYYREVLPGEIVEISKTGIKSLAIVPRPAEDPQAFCIFEYVYFSRPDTILEGILQTCTTIYL